MSIDVRVLDDAEEWNALVEKSGTATAFHLAEALDVLADESGMELHRLAGFKGQEACGVFPVFTGSVGPFTTAFSPPPDLKLNYLGPALVNTGKLKRRRLELRHGRFIDACTEWLDEEYDPDFSTVRTAPGYDDARPLLWNDYEATPRYTYTVDLTDGTDTLLKAFSSDARKNITKEHDADYEIRENGAEAIERILPAVTDRHAEQGEPFPIDASFVARLHDALPEGVVRALELHCEGEFVGGQVHVEFNDTRLGWISYADHDAAVPVTDLLDWRGITGAADRGVEAFDMMGANDRRLSRYKAKFAPTLTPYYRAERASWGMAAASRLYSRLR